MTIGEKFYNHIKKGHRPIISLFLLVMLFVGIIPTPASAIEPLLPQYKPTQHISSNPNLYVSAENSFFKYYFAGPQVIQVIGIHTNINRQYHAYGEPDVTMNGKKLRMAQATD